MPIKRLCTVSYSPAIVTMAVSVAVYEILASKSGVTLKTELGFVKGHWKWHHLIDRVRVLIRLPWRYLVSFARYSDLFLENREIFIPHLYLAPPQGVTPSEFREDV